MEKSCNTRLLDYTGDGLLELGQAESGQGEVVGGGEGLRVHLHCLGELLLGLSEIAFAQRQQAHLLENVGVGLGALPEETAPPAPLRRLALPAIEAAALRAA